jgi:hypothetical protein
MQIYVCILFFDPLQIVADTICVDAKKRKRKENVVFVG